MNYASLLLPFDKYRLTFYASLYKINPMHQHGVGQETNPTASTQLPL